MFIAFSAVIVIILVGMYFSIGHLVKFYVLCREVLDMSYSPTVREKMPVIEFSTKVGDMASHYYFMRLLWIPLYAVTLLGIFGMWGAVLQNVDIPFFAMFALSMAIPAVLMHGRHIKYIPPWCIDWTLRVQTIHNDDILMDLQSRIDTVKIEYDRLLVLVEQHEQDGTGVDVNTALAVFAVLNDKQQCADQFEAHTALKAEMIESARQLAELGGGGTVSAIHRR